MYLYQGESLKIRLRTEIFIELGIQCSISFDPKMKIGLYIILIPKNYAIWLQTNNFANYDSTKLMKS